MPALVPGSIAPGTFDPRDAIAAIDRAIPKDWEMVSGSGHSAYFQTHVRGRKPEQFHVMREFGAIGNSISIAIGVAAAKSNGKVVLIEGDGSLIMHIQELETVKRYGVKLLICAQRRRLWRGNPQAAPGRPRRQRRHLRPHRFRLDRPGLRTAREQHLAQLTSLMRDHDAQGSTEIWNIPISDQVTSPSMRRQVKKGHGVM
jgi:acetolactate synthase I/II/III large subunit